MKPSVLHEERLADLLVQQVTDGLNASEQAELDRLLAGKPYADASVFESTAAALVAASIPASEPMPADLRSRLREQADAFVSRSRAIPPRRIPGRDPSMRSAAMWLTLAASITLAIMGWWPAQQPSDRDETARASDVQRVRESLDSKASTLRWQWAPTYDPAAKHLAGEVVWDPASQRGYMVFRGLEANDPTDVQYQLWIFDGTRDERYPIDGGVFDMPRIDDEVIVPVVAKLPVREATRFVVTVERPGGVVVSARQRIVAVAPLESG